MGNSDLRQCLKTLKNILHVIKGHNSRTINVGGNISQIRLLRQCPKTPKNILYIIKGHNSRTINARGNVIRQFRLKTMPQNSQKHFIHN